MHHQRGQRVIRGQRLPAGDVLQIEGHSIRHPGACLDRSAEAHPREERAIGAANVDLYDVRSGGVPTERGRSNQRAGSYWYGIGAGGERRSRRGAGRVHRGETGVADKRIRARGRQVFDIKAAAGGTIQRYLNRRIAGNCVSPEDVSLNPRGQEDPVRVPGNDVVLNYVAGIESGNQADTKIITLRNVTISAKPVRTEPVVASATGKSYASARIDAVPVSLGDIVLKKVVGSADDDHTREAVGGHRDSGHGNPTAAEQLNTQASESLHQAKPANGNIL